MGNETSTQMGSATHESNAVIKPVSDAAAADKAGYGANNRDSTFEEKKEDHHPTSYKSRKSKRKGGDKRMANGKDIWNSDARAHGSDDQVHVNLAMADLMAYLQVVANNSNHLPLTRRDDPDLERSINELTSEEYARKSAAFVPADVRVLGGVFTRYGRVWDLPTSAEYNAVDGAHEPGRSYGGASANALLKVVYDAASDVADAAQTDAAAASLFDDDDDEADNMSFAQKSYKSGYSLDCAQPNPTTITWGDLLRKMKAEMKEIEYAQYPKITSTRKIDLNKPFSLVPEDFDAQKGKKRALLIGCNYKSMKDALLKASHDDVRSMKDYIVNVHGFPESDDLMTVLLDDKDHQHPTFKNITEAFKALSEQSQPGDAVFVQFSGHGGRVLDTDVEDASYDEVIVPSDYEQAGLIRDTLIFKTLLAPMRYGVTVTIVIDSCDNGMMLELPYAWSTKSDRQQQQLAKLSVNDDFSFVRFLKVVKTLYDSSTFTQLGKTVGLALNEDDEADLPEDDTQSVPDHETENELANDKSLFDIFTEACKVSKTRRKDGKESMMDKFINTCAFLAPEENFEGELTDEDTLRTDTGGFSYDDGSTAVSYTDDESVERRRHRNRRK
eukprot:CAMPEP_0172452888 /NCGR_PEP_ID=MMETSP1065-20121228/10415_1 /TAXON_ID=265537 /ORGANISM="Amphiprora paludosa, Strain CCMP125" /LENGTH=612 /DNA_ID=CAMNT_0013205019 /DNA_START=300 /DNA_END=2138 /DNA_ORIENTATION=+